MWEFNQGALEFYEKVGQQAVYEIPKRRKQAAKYQPENIP